MKYHNIVVVTVSNAEEVSNNTVAGTAEHKGLFDGRHRDVWDLRSGH